MANVNESIKLHQTEVYPKGQITIELLDKSGNVEKSIKTHNYVKDTFLAAKSRIMAHSGFQFLPLPAGIRNQHFGGITLTNYTGEEDPINDKLIKGDVIARATLGTTGHNTAGVLGSGGGNANIFRQDFHQTIWDWNIVQGNGTFQSIYMTLSTINNVSSGSSSSLHANNHQALAPLFSIGLPFTVHTLRRSNGKYYAHEGNVMRVFDDFNFSALTTATVANAQPLEYQEFTLPITANSFTIHNGEIFLTPTTGNVIQVVSTQNPEALIRTISSPMTGAQSIAYSPKHDLFYIHQGTTINAYEHTNFTSFLPTPVDTQVQAGATVHVRGLNLTANEDGILRAGWFTALDEDGKFLGAANQVSTNIWANNTHALGYVEINDEFTLVQTQDTPNNVVTFCANSTFLSRILLPEPVTKRDDQHMRIVYEYHIPTIEMPFTLENTGA